MKCVHVSKLRVEIIGNFKFVLNNGHIFYLENTFYASSISKILVSISRLVQLEFKFNFVISNVYIFKYSTFVDNGFLINGLYKLHLDSSFENSLFILHNDIDTKHNIHDES